MSDTTRQPPPKKDVALALLEESSVFVHLDPRKPDVVVPKWFQGQPQLVLQVGLNMAIPIPDLTVDDEGISCTLSFNRSPFWCRLPWSAIYALVGEDGRGGVWADDVPAEVQFQKQQGSPKAAPAKKQRPKLTAVAPVADEPKAEEPAEDASVEAPTAPEETASVEPKPAPRVAEVAALPKPVAQPALKSVEEETTEEPERAPPPPKPADKKGKREIPSYLRVIK